MERAGALECTAGGGKMCRTCANVAKKRKTHREKRHFWMHCMQKTACTHCEALRGWMCVLGGVRGAPLAAGCVKALMLRMERNDPMMHTCVASQRTSAAAPAWMPAWGVRACRCGARADARGAAAGAIMSKMQSPNVDMGPQCSQKRDYRASKKADNGCIVRRH